MYLWPTVDTRQQCSYGNTPAKCIGGGGWSAELGVGLEEVGYMCEHFVCAFQNVLLHNTIALLVTYTSSVLITCSINR